MYPRKPLPELMTLVPFTVSAALAEGVSRGRLRSHDLERPFHGVRAISGSTEGFSELCSALNERMPPGQFFSHQTAAMLWGIPLPSAQESRTLHVTAVLPARAPRLRGVIGHSIRGRTNVDVISGMLVHAPAETWCELAPVLTLDELIAAGDRLLGRPEPLCSPEDIRRAIAAYGSRRASRLLRESRPWIRSRVESPRETTTRLVIVRAGLPEPEANIAIPIAHGTKSTHGDLVYRRYRVVVEYDGADHEKNPGQYARDVVRLNDLAAAGWLVIRVNKYTTDEDIIARVRDALISRGWRP